MRNAIAKIQEEAISKGNQKLQNLIGLSMFDWSRSPMENNRRNEEVAVALQSLPPGVQEMDWLSSKDALELHSSLIRNGLHEVFAESPEMEAFSLMVQSPLRQPNVGLTKSILLASAMVSKPFLPSCA